MLAYPVELYDVAISLILTEILWNFIVTNQIEWKRLAFPSLCDHISFSANWESKNFYVGSAICIADDLSASCTIWGGLALFGLK